MKRLYITLTLCTFIILCIILTVCINAHNRMEWPLEFTKGLSATLGEVRKLRLHQGIDIKTKGRRGYPVFTSSYGRLSRIISKEKGYGNALLIDHGNDLVSLYGHLDSFEGWKHHIDSMSKALKILYNKEELDFSFYKSNLKYEIGDKIAYAGETGSGLPHLHFEIRKEGKYLNPLKYLSVVDKEPPVVQTLYICHQRENTTIHEEIHDVKEESEAYTIRNEPIIVKGFDEIFFKLSCYDMAGAKNRLSIYKISLFVDDEKTFEIAFDSILKNEKQHGYLIYDISKSTINDDVSYTYFLNRRDIGARYSILNSTNDGYIDLNGGIKFVRIVVSDLAGNNSSLRFRIIRENTQERSDATFFLIKRGNSYHFSNKTKDIEVDVFADSVFNDMLLRIKSSLTINYLKELADNFTIKKKNIFKLFSIYPFDSIYKNPIKVSFSQPGNISKKDIARTIIYHFFDGRKPKPLQTEYNSNKMTFSAFTAMNGHFALIRDRRSPRIFLPPIHEFCEDIDFYRKIRLHVIDILSGIDEQSIECYVDGEYFPNRYDKDRKWIEITLPKDAISKGLHHIFVKCSDKAENQAVFRDILMFN